MASNNTSTNPTFRGEITHPWTHRTFSTENNMQHEVISLVKKMEKQFGYDTNTVKIMRYDSATRDYVIDPEGMNLYRNPRQYKKGEKAKAPVEIVQPNEEHFIGAAKIADMWRSESRALKATRTRPEIPVADFNALVQDTLQALVDMGYDIQSIYTTLGQMEGTNDGEIPETEESFGEDIEDQYISPLEDEPAPAKKASKK